MFRVATILYKMTFNDTDDILYSIANYEMLKNNTQEWFALDYISEELQGLLTLMLQPDPALRPSIADVTKHAWVEEGVATRKEVEKWWKYIIWSTIEDKDKADQVREKEGL